MKNYSQTFVQYHGCGNSYLDGTNMLTETGRCATPTYNPFWKRPIESSNKIAKSTRNKLKIKLKFQTLQVTIQQLVMQQKLNKT